MVTALQRALNAVKQNEGPLSKADAIELIKLRETQSVTDKLKLQREICDALQEDRFEVTPEARDYFALCFGPSRPSGFDPKYSWAKSRLKYLGTTGNEIGQVLQKCNRFLPAPLAGFVISELASAADSGRLQLDDSAKRLLKDATLRAENSPLALALSDSFKLKRDFITDALSRCLALDGGLEDIILAFMMLLSQNTQRAVKDKEAEQMHAGQTLKKLENAKIVQDATAQDLVGHLDNLEVSLARTLAPVLQSAIRRSGLPLDGDVKPLVQWVQSVMGDEADFSILPQLDIKEASQSAVTNLCLSEDLQDKVVGALIALVGKLEGNWQQQMNVFRSVTQGLSGGEIEALTVSEQKERHENTVQLQQTLVDDVTKMREQLAKMIEALGGILNAMSQATINRNRA